MLRLCVDSGVMSVPSNRISPRVGATMPEI
jgi:hypothetical protein